MGFQILKAIRRIIRRTSEHSRRVSREGDLTIPQMLCLRSVDELSVEGEVTAVLIAEAIQLSTPTVSRIMDRLEQEKLVKRERDKKDRRRVCITLTPGGRKRIAQLPVPVQEQFLDRLDQLDPVERLGLLKALERVVELMDAEGMDAAPVLTPELHVSTPVPEKKTPR